MRLIVLSSALIAALLQAAVWYVVQRAAEPPDFGDRIASLSLAYEPQHPPFHGVDPSLEAIDRDLKLIAEVARKVRIYTALGNVAEVPRLAQKYNLDVTLGVWLDDERDIAGNVIPAVRERNQKELAAAIKLARENWNVRELMVGNEVLLRARMQYPDVATGPARDLKLSPEARLRLNDLVEYLRQAKGQIAKPVSTSEGWSEWAAVPELVKEVDFITTHNLPFWEQIRADRAMDYALEKYDLLRGLYPGKRVLIGEFGWPSQGYNRMSAVPNPLKQAQVVREFLIVAKQRGIDYNIVEAFDQPWKTFEGSNAGPYWGLYDSDRNPKFRLTGPVQKMRPWMPAGGILIGTLIAVWGLSRRRPTFGHALSYAVASNAIGAGIMSAAVYPFDYYLNAGLWFMWGVGFLMMLPLAIITLAKVHEIAEVILGHQPVRLIEPHRPKPVLPDPAPLVSIHVPAYKEPPEMLKATLDSMAKLDYPRFEVLAIVNNTPEEEFWKPIEEHCAKLGPNFKFVYLPKVAGFKAGALNTALKDMDPDAAVIAVVDADYQVHPNWLKDLVPWFEDPEVAIIQAPQDHRDGGENLLKTIMNAEYAGFFDIGMVQRNEDNAIIAHGTMLMVRRSAFDEAGGWATDTIVEDTELGLRLLARGHHAHYTRERYGWGLLPDTFLAFKTQRHRWAYGAMQIIRKHWRHMLPSSRTLTPQQKYHFVTGWAYWFSDAVGCAISFLNLIWVPLIILAELAFPAVSLTVPVLTAVLVNIVHAWLLYVRRVRIPKRQIAGAALAAMSLQYTVARAVVEGMIRDGLAFKRTEKGGLAKKKKADRPAQTETVMGLLLLSGAIWLWVANQFSVYEQSLFALTVLIQSIPFLCTTAMSLLEEVQNWRAARAIAVQGQLAAGLPAESQAK
jgi:cellulose synthase/poly-beta-1,6-N-acetylglucosamine synthase-like glycosyltransferase/exo-beta-1,3-glucanase (GH17 family)